METITYTNITGVVVRITLLNGATIRQDAGIIFGHDVVLDGAVRIGARARIGNGVHLGPDTSIGEDASIGSGCVVTRSYIGDRCELRQTSQVCDTTLGSDSGVSSNCMLQGITLPTHTHLGVGTHICTG